jgi:hypothetical protein
VLALLISLVVLETPSEQRLVLHLQPAGVAHCAPTAYGPKQFPCE